MPRSPMIARPATPDDVPVLADLWRELRGLGGRAERAINPVSVADIDMRLLEAIKSEHCQVVIAESEGEPAGMAVLRVIRPEPLSESRIVQISNVVVVPGKRRRGAGHALIAAAADFAEDNGLEHVAAGLFPSLREASRFYARLGFAPVLVERVAPVSILRRRLGAENTPGHFDDVVRRRNRLRRPVPRQRAAIRTTDRVD